MMIRGQSGLALVSVLILCGLTAHHANAAPPTRAEAFRFLNQATFGPTSAEIDRLTALGDSSQAYAQWIDEQILKALPPLVEEHRAKIGRFVEDQINGWQESRLVQELERELGPDLQYIRINGTLVGGMAGLLIAGITHFMRVSV